MVPEATSTTASALRSCCEMNIAREATTAPSATAATAVIEAMEASNAMDR
jgi:hypothetical protein